MGSEWKSGKLGDYVSSCLGKMLDKKKNKGDYQPYLGNSNVRWGYFELDNLSEMKFEPHELNRYGLKKGDLIVCEGGEPGRCAIWEEDVPTMMIQKALHRIRPFNELDSKYLFYWFLNAGRAGRLDPFFTGTTIKHLTGKALSQLPIDIPPMEHQRYSVNILSSLDDKIQLNKKTNQTLEQMAQALFKSWFVDFDPVFDNLLASVDFKLDNLETSLPDELIQKAQRRLAALNSLENATECKASLIALAHELQAQLPTKAPTPAAVQVSEKAAEKPVKPNINANPKILAQHANTHAHFPNEFEHNEQLGWIPKGWTSSTTGEQFTFKNGYAFKSNQLIKEEGIPVFKMGHIKRGGGFNANGTKSYFPVNLIDEKISAYFIQKGDLLMSMTDMKSNMVILGNTALMPESNKFLLNQRCGLLRKNTKTYLNYPYMYYFTNEKSVVEELRSRANSGVQVNLTTTSIKETTLLVPSKSVHDVFDVQVLSYLEKMFANDSSTSELIKLRNTLLPKLISGELHIPNVVTDDEVVD